MPKAHLECDFTKCDKTFRNFDADLPAGRVDETRMAYKEGFDGMVDSSSLSQPASLPHGLFPVPMIMVGTIKTPTEMDPKGKLKWRACPKGFNQAAPRPQVRRGQYIRSRGGQGDAPHSAQHRQLSRAGYHVPHPPRYPHGHLPGQARVNFDFTPRARRHLRRDDKQLNPASSL